MLSLVGIVRCHSRTAPEADAKVAMAASASELTAPVVWFITNTQKMLRVVFAPTGVIKFYTTGSCAIPF